MDELDRVATDIAAAVGIEVSTARRALEAALLSEEPLRTFGVVVPWWRYPFRWFWYATIGRLRRLRDE